MLLRARYARVFVCVFVFACACVRVHVYMRVKCECLLCIVLFFLYFFFSFYFCLLKIKTIKTTRIYRNLYIYLYFFNSRITCFVSCRPHSSRHFKKTYTFTYIPSDYIHQEILQRPNWEERWVQSHGNFYLFYYFWFYFFIFCFCFFFNDWCC